MKNRILRSALSVALCAAMLLSQGLTVFADGEIDLAAAKSSPVQESSEEFFSCTGEFGGVSPRCQ